MDEMRKILTLFLCVCLCFGMTGCKKQELNTEISLVDQIGREVKLEKPAEKVISSYYISSSLMIALGLEENMIGIEMKANTRNIYKEAAPNLLDVPAMGNSKTFNIEECAALEPDLVVLPVKLKEYEEQLNALNIPVLFVNPETEEDFRECVKLIAQATGTSEKGEALLAAMDTIKAKVKASVKTDTEKKKVYFAGGDSILKAATASMYQNELIQTAMGENVTADLNGKGWTEITAEQLLSYNPDVICLENGANTDIDAILNDVRFKDVEAIKNKQVYVFPSKLETWDTPNPSSALGIYWLSSILYPEAIAMEDVIKEAVKFYKDFYEIDITEEGLGF